MDTVKVQFLNKNEIRKTMQQLMFIGTCSAGTKTTT